MVYYTLYSSCSKWNLMYNVMNLQVDKNVKIYCALK